MSSSDGRPPASSAAALARMQSARRRDTGCEVRLRRELHALGLRFRIDRPLPTGGRRRADITLARHGLIVFVDGCFWHGCPEHRTIPRANRAWWEAKLATNTARDRDTDQRLRAAGWDVLRFWEHECPAAAAGRVLAWVRGGTKSSVHQSPRNRVL